MIDRVGPYQIERELGRGGMGVVYLARDTRLDRDVAIKALPPEMASDPARLERFEREAKTLAGLHHPNIAGIYGVEEQDGARYLVLEFVEGETLADRLDRGPLPVDEALELAAEIAAGVEAAHEAGVIHRDLKPGNIIVTPEGRAKVLDFGLARAEETQGSSSGGLDSPTMTTPQPQHSPTIAGAILGTAAYMSPEQARGRKVDKRTDIWSFGVVLYEMLVGSSPFRGETATDSIGAVLHKDVDLEKLPKETPANVKRVLRRCLERDRNLRFRDIGDARIELALADAGAPDGVARTVPRRSAAWLVGATVITALAGAGGVWLLKPTPSPAPTPIVRLSMVLPWERSRVRDFAMSADGRSLAIIASEESLGAPEWGVYLRRLGEIDFERIHTMQNRPVSVAFTPDGRDLILAEASESGWEYVYRLSLADRRPVALIDGDAERFRLGDSKDLWLNDDEFLLCGDGDDHDQVFAVSRHNGAIRPLIALPETNTWNLLTSVSPDGRRALYTAGHAEGDRFDFRVHLIDLATGQSFEVAERAGRGRFLSPDTIAILRDGRWFATHMNPMTGAAQGTLLPLVAPASSEAIVAGSEAGHLAYFTEREERGRIALLDREGASTTLFSEQRWYEPSTIRSSLDGAWICVVYGERSQADRYNLAVVDVATGRHQVIASGAVVPSQWLPDGRLLFVTNPNSSATDERTILADVMSWRADRGVEALLTQVPLRQPQITATPDASRIVMGRAFTEADRLAGLAAGNKDYLAVVDLSAPNDAPAIYHTSGGWHWDPALSPDGRWLAFTANPNGTNEIFVTRFEDAEKPRPVQVSTNGGTGPVWSRDGSELFYMEPQPGSARETLMRVTIAPGESPEISAPSPILGADALDEGRLDPWADGRFVYIDTPEPDPDDEHLQIVLHWVDNILRQLAK